MTGTRETGARTLLELRHWIPSRFALAAVAGLSLVGGLLEAFVVGLVAAVAAAVAQGQTGLVLAAGPISVAPSVRGALAAGAVAVTVMVVARLSSAAISSRVAAQTLVATRTRLLGAYLGAAYEVQRTIIQAELHDLVAFQAMRMSQAVLTVTRALSAALSFLALVAVAVLFDAATAAVMMALSLVLAAVFLPLVRRSNQAGQAHLDAQVAVGIELGDVSGLLAEIQVYGAHRGMMGRMGVPIRQSGAAFRTAAFMAQLTPTLYLTTVLVLLLGALFVLDVSGVADLQTVGAIALLMLRGLRYSQQVQSQLQVAVEHAPDVASVTDATDRFEHATARDEGDEVGRVEELLLEGVTYHHPGSREGVEGVDVRLRRGEVVGVVGHSGAGKTTFAELVLGLRAPSSGRVLVNGRARESFRPRSWLSHVAYVGQEARLLSGTVAANVAFFRDVDPDQVERVLRSASLADDLGRWAAGDQREVGAGGRDVSGGQRQRVAIARALVGQPDVIVMDEPTSALDPESESRIRDTIAALAGEVLVVVVAHRHSTLDVCDRILRFEQGRCSELPRERIGEVPLEQL